MNLADLARFRNNIFSLKELKIESITYLFLQIQGSPPRNRYIFIIKLHPKFA